MKAIWLKFNSRNINNIIIIFFYEMTGVGISYFAL